MRNISSRPSSPLLCSSPAQKLLWWSKLSELIEKERSHTPQSTNIQVTYFDQATNFEHVSTEIDRSFP